MNLKDKIGKIVFIRTELSMIESEALAAEIIEIIAKHLNGVQLGLFDEQG